MLLAGGVIGPLAGMMTGRLTGEMTGDRLDVLTEVVIAVITLEGVASVSYHIDVRAGTAFINNDVPIVVGIDVMIHVLVGVLACTYKGAVSDTCIPGDVGASIWETVMAALKFETLPTSFDELLLFCWTSFRS